jgi:hypothetical protein
MSALNITISGPLGHYDFEENWVDPETFTLSGVLELDTERNDMGYMSYILTASCANDVVEFSNALHCSGISCYADPEAKTFKVSASDVTSLKVTPQS